MGKGSAPRSINDRKKFNDNWDKVFKDKEGPKCKAQIMREMRAKRRGEGLRELTIWVSSDQEAAIKELLGGA